MKQLNQFEISDFKQLIWDYYTQHGRIFSWRHVDDPYLVVVSEIMLQQTQTYRVEKKFEQFITTFDSFEILANASLRQVLALWQGLGYNRRGMYLHQLAQKVVTEYSGVLPNEPAILQTFPGIGPATAASICAFAFNKPTIFIETNIRTVFIHHFFSSHSAVHDKEIVPLIAATIDHDQPRDWYYALMDYGVALKKKFHNPSRRSKHHVRQSLFQGSDRQIRGKIIALLTHHTYLSFEQIHNFVQCNNERLRIIIDQLCKETLISYDNNLFFIT